MKFRKFAISITIMILVFTFAVPLHNQSKINSTPEFITGNKSTTEVTNLSNGSVNVITSNCNPSYYIVNETGFNQTEYTFNATGFLNKNDNGLTENNIIVKQENNTLFEISYGRKNSITRISGLNNYTGILNLSKCNVNYTIHIVFSKNMANHALIWQGNTPLIPSIITLQKPYIEGNISFMFGGKYSNQTIGKINVNHYKKMEYSNPKSTYNLNYSDSFRLKFQPLSRNNTVFFDHDLNSIIYITENGTIEKYNYYSKNYSAIAKINKVKNGNISSFSHGADYVYYAWNSTETSVYSVNKTTLSVINETYKNNNMTHLIFYNGAFIFYSLNGNIMFQNGPRFNFGSRILSIRVNKNICITAMNKTGIIHYEITPEYQKIALNFNPVDTNYSIVYFYINNGISSYFQIGNLTSFNGTLYYKFDFIANNMGLYNNTFYIHTNKRICNSEIKTGKFSVANSTIISVFGNFIYLHTDSNLFSPDSIKITSIGENVKFNDTVIALNVSSNLNYKVTAHLLNKSYDVRDNRLNISLNIKTGNYTVNFTAVNAAGYINTRNYIFLYNNTRETNNTNNTNNTNKTSLLEGHITGIKIINKDNAFYVAISGNNTDNLTIAWYINGVYSNSGIKLNSKLPLGLDSISVKVTQDGRAYKAEKRVAFFGNIPYYAGFAGVASILFIFIMEIFYYNNKDVNEILKELNGLEIKEIVKAGRKRRIGKRVVMSKIKLLSLSGKLSIERDMDNNKFVFLSRRYLENQDEIKK